VDSKQPNFIEEGQNEGVRGQNWRSDFASKYAS